MRNFEVPDFVPTERGESKSHKPEKNELPPERFKALMETILEVRYAAVSLPAKEREVLIQGRDSIIASRLHAESNLKRLR
jgi:hypothetical protein